MNNKIQLEQEKWRFKNFLEKPLKYFLFQLIHWFKDNLVVILILGFCYLIWENLLLSISISGLYWVVENITK